MIAAIKRLSAAPSTARHNPLLSRGPFCHRRIIRLIDNQLRIHTEGRAEGRINLLCRILILLQHPHGELNQLPQRGNIGYLRQSQGIVFLKTAHADPPGAPGLVVKFKRTLSTFRRFLGSGQKATQQQECSRDHIRIDRMFHSPPYIPWCICFDAICPKDVAEAPAPAYNRSSLLGDSSCLSTLRSASSRSTPPRLLMKTLPSWGALRRGRSGSSRNTFIPSRN